MKPKTIPSAVYYAILIVICLASVAAFFIPLVAGLLIYYDVNGLGTACAKAFIERTGADMSQLSSTTPLSDYYLSLYRLLGLSLFTFCPLTAYGFILLLAYILELFGVEMRWQDDWPMLGLTIATLAAIALAVVYWWGICQPGATSTSIMDSAKVPMHWGYRLMFYIFPLLSIIIQGIAIGIGISLADNFGMEDMPIVYPLFSLVGVAIGGGLIALMYFVFVKILIFVISIAGGVFLILLFLSCLSPSQRYYTDPDNPYKTRKYHEDVFGEAYIDESDEESWKD